MIHQQKVTGKKKSQNGPTIVDNRTPKVPALSSEQDESGGPPVRAVFFIEVGGMGGPQLALLMQRANEEYSQMSGGNHYAIPVRNGKIGTDVVFEQEWLDKVRETCTIVDGQIVLRDGAREVQVVRTMVE